MLGNIKYLLLLIAPKEPLKIRLHPWQAMEYGPGQGCRAGEKGPLGRIRWKGRYKQQEGEIASEKTKESLWVEIPFSDNKNMAGRMYLRQSDQHDETKRQNGKPPMK